MANDNIIITHGVDDANNFVDKGYELVNATSTNSGQLAFIMRKKIEQNNSAEIAKRISKNNMEGWATDERGNRILGPDGNWVRLPKNQEQSKAAEQKPKKNDLYELNF